MTKKKSVRGLRDGTCTASAAEIEAASQERPDLKEYEKNYLCGTCCIGWDTIEEFMQHITSHEHGFHKERNAARMVPGLGFCGACYCIMQCEMNWNKHTTGVKHKKCVASLEAAEALGADRQSQNYIYPLSCQVKGELGPPMPSTDINCQEANRHGFGHGGAMARNTPIVGMNYITKLPPDHISTATRQLAGDKQGGVFYCSLCEEEFVFYHRSRHLNGAEHRTKYLAAHHSERLEDVKSVKYRVLKLLYHCAQVEEDEKKNSTTEAKSLRRLFFAVPRTGHRDALPRPEREKIQAERYSLSRAAGVSPSLDYPGRRGRGRDFAKRRNMNFDIDSVPLGRPTQHRSRSRSRERSPESRYRRDQRSFRDPGGDSRDSRKPQLSEGARAFLKNSDRTQDNFPSGSVDPYAATGLDAYGVQRSADRYAALGIHHPWEDPSLLEQGGGGMMGIDHSGHAMNHGYRQTPEATEAIAALDVLEKFAGIQAASEVKKKIEEMKKSVLSGHGIGADAIVQMASSLKPSRSAAPPMPPLPPMPNPPVGYPQANQYNSFLSPDSCPQGRGGFASRRGGAGPSGSYPTDTHGYPTYTNQPVGYGQPKPPVPPTYGAMNTGPQTKFYTKSKSGKEFLPITEALGDQPDYSATAPGSMYKHNY